MINYAILNYLQISALIGLLITLTFYLLLKPFFIKFVNPIGFLVLGLVSIFCLILESGIVLGVVFGKLTDANLIFFPLTILGYLFLFYLVNREKVLEKFAHIAYMRFLVFFPSFLMFLMLNLMGIEVTSEAVLDLQWELLIALESEEDRALLLTLVYFLAGIVVFIQKGDAISRGFLFLPFALPSKLLIEQTFCLVLSEIKYLIVIKNEIFVFCTRSLLAVKGFLIHLNQQILSTLLNDLYWDIVVVPPSPKYAPPFSRETISLMVPASKLSKMPPASTGVALAKTYAGLEAGKVSPVDIPASNENSILNIIEIQKMKVKNSSIIKINKPVKKVLIDNFFHTKVVVSKECSNAYQILSVKQEAFYHLEKVQEIKRIKENMVNPLSLKEKLTILDASANVDKAVHHESFGLEAVKRSLDVLGVSKEEAKRFHPNIKGMGMVISHDLLNDGEKLLKLYVEPSHPWYGSASGLVANTGIVNSQVSSYVRVLGHFAEHCIIVQDILPGSVHMGDYSIKTAQEIIPVSYKHLGVPLMQNEGIPACSYKLCKLFVRWKYTEDLLVFRQRNPSGLIHINFINTDIEETELSDLVGIAYPGFDENVIVTKT